MAFEVGDIDILPAEPIRAGEEFKIIYAATNNGSADEPAHTDHVEMWRSDGQKPLDVHMTTDPARAGDAYSVIVDVPAQEAGFYDIMVTLPDGTGRGRSLRLE
jgi:hypothetical protein